MGVDIHMYIIDKNGEYTRDKSIYDGRNSEWFNNLQDRGWDECYDSFPNYYGIPEESPENLKETYDNARDNGYYGFNYVKVSEYIKWFNKVQPHIDAGWLSTYQEWQYKTKGIIPEDVPHYFDDDWNPNDYHFVEFEKRYDPSKWLYDYLIDNKIDTSDYICYYFDC